MILTIDVGNTNTVLGIFENGELKNHWRISTDKDKTPDEYGILLQNLFSTVDKSINSKIKGIIISSVVPPVVMVLKETARNYYNIDPLIIGPGVKTGINIKTENPREVGADRIVNAVAAREKYSGSLIIVDFGTATTFCAVSKNGSYLGGAIAPGIGISTEALFDYAAKLPRIELKNPGRAVGKNTIKAMKSGIIYGFVGQVEKMVDKFKNELTGENRVIATGGLVELIYRETEVIDKVEPYLTLQGLSIIGRLNDVKG